MSGEDRKLETIRKILETKKVDQMSEIEKMTYVLFAVLDTLDSAFFDDLDDDDDEEES